MMDVIDLIARRLLQELVRTDYLSPQSYRIARHLPALEFGSGWEGCKPA